MRNPVVVEEMIPAVSPNPLEMPMRKLAYLWRRRFYVEITGTPVALERSRNTFFNGWVTWISAVFMSKDIQRDVVYLPALKLSVH